MTNPPTLLGMPTEIRFKIFNCLFATATRKHYAGIAMANRTLKDEVDAEFLKVLKSQLQDINDQSAKENGPIRTTVNIPDKQQTTYNLLITLRLQPDGFSKSRHVDFLGLLCPIVALNVESVTVLTVSSDYEDFKATLETFHIFNEFIYNSIGYGLSLDSYAQAHEQGLEGNFAVRPNRVVVEARCEAFEQGCDSGAKAEMGWSVKYQYSALGRGRAIWTRNERYRK